VIRRVQIRQETGEPGLGAFNTDRVVPFAKFDAFLPLSLIWWLGGTVAIYTWAGEKMPWLMMHMTRPAIFLASLFIGALAMSLIARRRQRLVDAGMLDDGEEEASYAPLVGRESPRLAGAHFSLDSILAGSWFGAKRQPAYAYAHSPDMGTVRYSSGRNIPNPPSRRQPAYATARGGARAAAVPMASTQDPPWVRWNRANSTFPFWSFVILFVLFAVAWGMSMSRIIYMVDHQESITSNGQSVVATYANSWGIIWLYPILMLALTIAYAVWLGVGRTLRYLAVGILAVFGIYEFHSAFMLSYRNPDVSTEMAVYVQTSPDVTRAMKELQDFSYYTTGAKDVKVVYDSEVSWPMEWYLGDYKNKKFIGGGAPSTSDYDAPVMFLGYNRLDDPQIKASYVPQRYALRWWFPEEWYKNDFLQNQFQKDANGNIVTDPVTGASKELPLPLQMLDFGRSAFRAVTIPENTAQLWKYLMYREPPKPLGSTDFVLFVRKDVAQLWHNLQNEAPPSSDLPVQQQWTNGPTPNREHIP
jgi:hypothetical protein